MPEFGVFSRPCFLAFGLNKEIHRVNTDQKTPSLGTFSAVHFSIWNLFKYFHGTTVTINVNDTMYGTVIVSLLRREPKDIFFLFSIFPHSDWTRLPWASWLGAMHHGHRDWVPCTMGIVIGCHVPWTRHHDLKGFTHQSPYSLEIWKNTEQRNFEQESFLFRVSLMQKFQMGIQL